VVDDGIMPVINAGGSPNSCSEVEFTVTEVRDILKSLKPSDAVGPDGFSSNFYKQIAMVVCRPLASIFSLSFSTGTLPSAWKTSKVVPIFKKGEASEPSNYRPVALTCVPCKVMERIIRNYMLSFVEENSII